MRKFIKIVFFIVLMIFIVVSQVACDEETGENSDITITQDKDALIGLDYKDVEEYFRNLGFTDIELIEKYYTTGFYDGEVTDIVIVEWIFGEDEFSNGDSFDSDSTIEITYMKYREKTDDDTNDEIMLTKNKSELIGKDYKEVEEYFRNLGFDDIETDYYTYDDGIVDGEVIKIAIVDWIFKETDFSAGDVFSSDCTIKIYYNKLEEKTPEESEPVFYSTNTYEDAQKGNIGVFSYVSKSGSYDVYWIIDFDNECVYYFTDGIGETVCDKLKIVSGTLNDRITIKWDSQTTWYLHFKYVNSPETLVVNDHFGSAIEFTTKDLSKALAIKGTKTIKTWR